MSFPVLLTSVGRRVALVKHLQDALARRGLRGPVVGADLRKHAPAFHAADVGELVPRVTDPGYVPALLEIVRRHGVRMVLPLIDTELHLLAPHRADFEAEGARLVVSSIETTTIALDKRLTAKFFAGANVRTPTILDPAKLLADPSTKYPLLLKPADGSCSVGVTKIDGPRELEFFLGHVPNAIVQELIRGKEYTLDALVDFHGRVRMVVPRLRMETRAGEVSKGMTVKDARLIEATRALVEKMPGAVGTITVQCFVEEGTGELVFLEVNPRFGGGFPLTAAAGGDFGGWLVDWIRGEDPAIAMDGFQDRLVMLRWDDAVFVPEASIL
jgi:carbamoyl-phosphate synthase large subunit